MSKSKRIFSKRELFFSGHQALIFNANEMFALSRFEKKGKPCKMMEAKNASNNNENLKKRNNMGSCYLLGVCKNVCVYFDNVTRCRRNDINK